MADGRSKKRPGIDAQRRRILDTALALFAREGSRAVSIAALCRSADVSRPTFYRCFDDKEAVLSALYDEAVHGPIRHGLTALADGGRDGKAVVDEVIDALFDRGAHARFLFAEARDPESTAHAIIDRAHEQAVDAIQTWQRSRGAAPLSRTVLKSLMVAWQWMVAEHLDGGEAGKAEVKQAAWELARRTLLDRRGREA